ncbi:PREDICTED: uncharacterized protein LOC106818421 [Priapulus caudatus]|uniref:Uncharacterized protein LOC106818421 n=1 Tax=Priapulus caudatus TaxID=37621 RepID=A0ABM1F2E7_PRICU|nr:PREDICTED: uncharacterized protein LOC106818421 [Priapulus caudatus]
MKSDANEMKTLLLAALQNRNDGYEAPPHSRRKRRADENETWPLSRLGTNATAVETAESTVVTSGGVTLGEEIENLRRRVDMLASDALLAGSKNASSGEGGAVYVRWGRTSCPETGAELIYDVYTKVISMMLIFTGEGGAVYVRWGRTSCPETGAELIYDGVAGNSHHTHTGGGGDYQCLPNEPQWGRYADGFQGKNYIYGVEHEINGYNPFLDSHLSGEALHNQDAVCAVCRTQGRASKLMIPAWKTCPQSWTLEYHG